MAETDLGNRRALLELVDRERRERVDWGFVAERSPHVVRQIDASGRRGWVAWSNFDDTSLEAGIAAEVARFRAAGQGFEWKCYDHDGPARLPHALVAAGFRGERWEALMMARVTDLATRLVAPVPPPLVLEPLAAPDDFAGVRALQETVWRRDSGWLEKELRAEWEADPKAIAFWLVREGQGGPIVSAAWMRFPHRDTESSRHGIAHLHGGATLPAWRRRGLYRALLAARARAAAERGVTFFAVDASQDSRPVLAGCGFEVIGGSRPFLWEGDG
jgi:GNAT superfamily N-acetyltransferase